MSDELPKGWASAPFMDVFDIQGGTQPPKSTFKYEPTKGYVRLLQIRDFGEKPLPTFIQSKPTLKTCQKDDILIGRYGASIGRICTGMEGAYNVALAKVIIPAQIDRRFVFHVLRSPFFQRPILDIERSAQDGFNKEDLAEIILPLAPLAEQQRIVAKLEKLLGQVDACQQRLEKMPTLLKRFRQSILAAACSGRLTADWREENESEVEDGVSVEVPESFPLLPETWRWKLLESVCEKIVDCPHSTPKWAESGRLCVRTTNFKPGLLDLSVVRYVSDVTFNQRVERLRPKSGDILYSREGGILGIACMIPPKVELCLGQRMMLFRTKPDFSAALLMHWLNSRVILGQVQELTGGSASPHLNVRDIKSFPTPVAPLAEQQEIVRRVEGLFALADQLELRLTQARKQVDKLTPSLLARAFAGQLVPQNPADEPAEKLLERIRNSTKE